jgi:uncharacterized protein (TIGR02246 family)
MQRLMCAVSASVFLAAAGIVSAQDMKTTGQRPIPEVRKLLTEVEECLTRGDAKGLAACWTAGGDFAGPSGERIEGRHEIAKAFQELFATRKNRNVKLQVASLRLASEDLVLLDMIAQVKPVATESTTEDSLLSVVLVKRDGRWLIESARETATNDSSPAQHLKPLEWLVGNWGDKASAKEGGLVMQSTCDWTVNRAFLIRKFKVEGRADVVRAGTEIIGWDPRTRRIRSWVFDSDGGFGDNVWIRDGDRWIVRHTGVRPDGSEASATNILTVVDADTVTVQSKDRMAGGERQPDVAAVTIKRQKPMKAAVKPQEPARQPERVLPLGAGGGR